MTKWFMPIVLAVIVLISPLVGRAQNSISVLDTSAQIFFPSGLTFNIKAESQSDIVKLRLHYQVERRNFASVTAEAWPVVTPSPKVQTQWVWDMRKAVLPIGANVIYWWTIEDASGSTITTPSQTVRFEDLRHKWNSVTSGKITLLWYQGNQIFVNQLMAACQQALDRLAQDTGVQLEQPVNIYIYASQADLLSAMVFPQEWSGGFSYYEYGLIAIGIPTNDLDWGKGAIAHELGHMVTHQITFSPYGAVLPLWLDEGLAMYAQGKPDPYLESVLKNAIAQHNLISVRSLASPFSAISAEAYLSYAESQSIVPFLIQNYGGDKMLQLLNLLKEGNTYDDALVQVYGFDQDGLDTLWQKYITSPAPSQAKITYDFIRPDIKVNSSRDMIAGKLFTTNALSGVD